MKELFEQGVAASKEFAVKAGAKAQDLGERGILMLEIKQLEGQAKRLISRLGNEAYRAFVEQDQPAIDRDSNEIKTILSQIASVKETIERKEAEIKLKQG
jgi:HJR/Mrr/RecB family endonuclease